VSRTAGSPYIGAVTAPRTALDQWPARAGFASAALALVPLAGWGAGWPALAAFAAGWPPVSPAAAAAVGAAGLALAGQHAATSQGLRRVTAGAAAVALAAVALVALGRQPARLPALQLSDAVAAWHDTPGLLARALPSVPAAAALLFLAVALAGLAWARPVGLRVAYAGATGAALVALLSASASPASPVATTLGPQPPDRLVPPAFALLVLLLASGILLRRGEDGTWWLPTRGAAAAAARVLLPTVLVLPPAAVWCMELLLRRRALDAETASVLLPALLVLLLGLAAAAAVDRVRRLEARDRDRDARRVRRQVQRETEQVAAQAEATLRVASDHFRTHLRTILDVAPTPFVAVDRAGYVSYANAAAATLFGQPLDDVVGRGLADAWPALGDEVGRALAASVSGAPVERTLTDRRTGRSIELRGFPGEDGAAVFLQPVADGAGRR
jgi:PAS domain S-box-containing protein